MPDSNAFIVAAYAVTWAGVLGYLWYLHRARAAAVRTLRAARGASEGQRHG